jgi:hypothetical protein
MPVRYALFAAVIEMLVMGLTLPVSPAFASNWASETAGPNTLERQGWSRSSLKIGDRITVVRLKARA